MRCITACRLPASYDEGAVEASGAGYPVLYFLHGLGDNEQTLFNSGGWTLIDDLRKQHKIGEFLIVAPEGDRRSTSTPPTARCATAIFSCRNLFP